MLKQQDFPCSVLHSKSRKTTPQKYYIGKNKIKVDAHYPTTNISSPRDLLTPISNLMEYYSAVKKNSFESVLMRWMKLEPILQS